MSFRDTLVSSMNPRAVLSLIPFSPEERALLDRRGVSAIDPAITGRNSLNERIGALQARHLIERGRTRLAIARLRDARQDPFREGREAGVREECRRAGLPEPASVRLDIDLAAALAALDSLDTPGVGIVCYNDDVATRCSRRRPCAACVSPMTSQSSGWTTPAFSGDTPPPHHGGLRRHRAHAELHRGHAHGHHRTGRGSASACGYSPPAYPGRNFLTNRGSRVSGPPSARGAVTDDLGFSTDRGASSGLSGEVPKVGRRAKRRLAQLHGRRSHTPVR